MIEENIKSITSKSMCRQQNSLEKCSYHSGSSPNFSILYDSLVELTIFWRFVDWSDIYRYIIGCSQEVDGSQV